MDIAAIETCPERDKYIAILMDEMHIKGSLVYDKHSGIKHINYYCHEYLETSISGSLVGYTEIGDINSHVALKDVDSKCLHSPVMDLLPTVGYFNCTVHRKISHTKFSTLMPVMSDSFSFFRIPLTSSKQPGMDG